MRYLYFYLYEKYLHRPLYDTVLLPEKVRGIWKFTRRDKILWKVYNILFYQKFRAELIQYKAWLQVKQEKWYLSFWEEYLWKLMSNRNYTRYK